MSFTVGLILFFLGIVFTAIHGVILRDNDVTIELNDEIFGFVFLHLFALISLIGTCIIPISAVLACIVIGDCNENGMLILMLLLILLPTIWVLLGGGYYFKKISLVFFVTFGIVFIILGSSWEAKYIINKREIESNIEYVTRESEKLYKQRDLVWFYGIPVNSKLDTEKVYVVNTNSNAETSDELTSETIPYWYVNVEGKKKFKTCPAKDAEINTIPDDEVPYIKIMIHYTTKVKIDHNGDGPEANEEVIEEKQEKKYCFYLHKDIADYYLRY